MEPRNQETEIEIDLKQLFFAWWDKKWIILLTGIVLALAAFVVTKLFITPTYTSESSIYVMNTTNDQLTSSDVSVSTSLTADYEVMVKSRGIMEQVIENLNLSISANDLSEKISITNKTNTRVLNISVTDSDPYLAKQIVDEVAKTSREQLMEWMGVDITIFATGNVAQYPSAPSVKMNTVLAGLIGVFLSSLIVIIFYFLDDTIKTPEDVEKYLGVSVLGSIPISEDEKQKNKKSKKRVSAKKTVVAK